MKKIEEEFKRVYEIRIGRDGLKVKWLGKTGGSHAWELDSILEKDFKIIGNQYGEKAGVIKIEIG